MNARRKLNVAFANGAFVIAALAGLATQSWVVFLVALALALALNVYVGSIRFSRKNRR